MSPTSHTTKIRPVGAALIHAAADGKTDRDVEASWRFSELMRTREKGSPCPRLEGVLREWRYNWTLILGTKWWVIIFTPRPLYPQRQNPLPHPRWVGLTASRRFEGESRANAGHRTIRPKAINSVVYSVKHGNIASLWSFVQQIEWGTHNW